MVETALRQVAGTVHAAGEQHPMTPALVAHSLALLHGLRCQKKGKRNRMKIAAKGVRFLASAKPTAAPLDPEAGRHMHLNPRMSVMPPEDKVAMRSFVGCVSHPTSPEPLRQLPRLSHSQFAHATVDTDFHVWRSSPRCFCWGGSSCRASSLTHTDTWMASESRAEASAHARSKT